MPAAAPRAPARDARHAAPRRAHREFPCEQLRSSCAATQDADQSCCGSILLPPQRRMPLSPPPSSLAWSKEPPLAGRDGALGSGHPEGAWGPTREKETGRRRPRDPDGGRGKKRVQWKRRGGARRIKPPWALRTWMENNRPLEGICYGRL